MTNYPVQEALIQEAIQEPTGQVTAWDRGIHPTAVISPKAVLGKDVSVGAFSIIGDNVVIGDGSKIGHHVVIEGYTTIGENNEIFHFASVGAKPQDLKFHGEKSQLVIGNKNIIREFTTLQPGTEGGGMITRIGDGNLFMANSHVGHDCIVGNNNIIANSVALAGHVTLGNRAVLGGLCAIHQFCRIGDFAMVGGGSMVERDVPPFAIVQGDRAKLRGVNTIGLQRSGASSESVREIRSVYRSLLKGEGSLEQRILGIEKELASGTYPNSQELVLKLLSFWKESKRGVCAAVKSGLDS